MFNRFRRKNNDLMVKKPNEEVLKAHNEAEIINRTYAFLTRNELIFKENPDIIISLDTIVDCKINGKKVDIDCADVSYMVMFTNKNLAMLFFDYLNRE